jgi:hypothetical protein
MSQKQIDGEMYYWVDYKSIIDDLPMLNVTNKEVIARIFKNLVNAKVLKHKTLKQGGTYSFYKLGSKYPQLITSTTIDDEIEPITEQKPKKAIKQKKAKETKKQYGTYVFLTETEYNKLCEDYTTSVITNKIKEIDNWLYKKFNGDEVKARAYYKDYNKALRNTWLGDTEQYKPKVQTTTNTPLNTNTSGIYFDENGNLQRRE